MEVLRVVPCGTIKKSILTPNYAFRELFFEGEDGRFRGAIKQVRDLDHVFLIPGTVWAFPFSSFDTAETETLGQDLGKRTVVLSWWVYAL